VAKSLTEFLPAWVDLLRDDDDSLYILDGIQNGFVLEDTDSDLPEVSVYHRANYRAAMSPENRDRIEQQLQEGLRDGHTSSLILPL
jgi:hypothetical protein